MCNQFFTALDTGTLFCGNCGVAFTDELNISQLEEMIKNGNPEDLSVVSALTDAAIAYLKGTKGAQIDKEKAREYVEIAAENGGGAALFMLGNSDIDNANKGEGELSHEDLQLLFLGLVKLARAHHIGYQLATHALTAYIDVDPWGISNDIIEMMSKSDPQLWDFKEE